MACEMVRRFERQSCSTLALYSVKLNLDPAEQLLPVQLGHPRGMVPLKVVIWRVASNAAGTAKPRTDMTSKEPSMEATFSLNVCSRA